METYNVCFLEEALGDLEEIVLYIARCSRASVLSMHDEIIEKANEISIFPRRGQPVPDAKMSNAGFRMLRNEVSQMK